MESQKPSKILFIGAGASKGAREGLGPEPPIGPTLTSWLKAKSAEIENLTGLVDLRGTLQEGNRLLDTVPSEMNFEEMLGKLGTEDRRKIQRMMIACFVDLTRRGKLVVDFGFRTRQDGFDQLITKIGFDETSWAAISLNYDVLFEQAVWRKFSRLVYPHFPRLDKADESGQIGFRLYKPHGSINFFAHGDHQFSFGSPVKDENRGRPTKFDIVGDQAKPNFPICMSTMFDAENILNIANRSTPSYPVMANFMKGKGVDVNNRNLDKVRDEALTLVAKASELLMVGVNPFPTNDDDPFVAALMAKKFDKVTFVTKDASAAQHVKGLWSHAIIHAKGLKDFLNSK